VLYMLWKGLVCILQNPTKAMDLWEHVKYTIKRLCRFFFSLTKCPVGHRMVLNGAPTGALVCGDQPICEQIKCLVMRYSTLLILNNTGGKGICVSKLQPYRMNCTYIYTWEEHSRMIGRATRQFWLITKGSSCSNQRYGSNQFNQCITTSINAHPEHHSNLSIYIYIWVA
jgi:hypothetical protein